MSIRNIFLYSIPYITILLLILGGILFGFTFYAIIWYLIMVGIGGIFVLFVLDSLGSSLIKNYGEKE